MIGNVIDHALTIQNKEIEYIVGDDASTDQTEKIVKSYKDDRIKYYRNEENLGYERNLLKIVKKASGKFVMPLADEDKIELSSIEWLLERIGRAEKITAIIGGFGKPTWKYKCTNEKIVDGGKAGIVQFACEDHDGFHNIWSRYYIGGFVLRRSALDPSKLSNFQDSYYIHNFLIYQAVENGKTLYTPKHLCFAHYYGKIGGSDHRIWAGVDKYDWKFNIDRHGDRIEFITKCISIPEARQQLLKIEQRWIAQVTGWALLSPNIKFVELRTQSLSIGYEQKVLKLYTGYQFWELVGFYLILYFVPFSSTISSMDNRCHPSKEARVIWWLLIFRHFIPEYYRDGAERVYFNSTNPVYWWNSLFEPHTPKRIQSAIKTIYYKLKK